MNEEEAIKQLKQWLSVIDLKKKSNIIPNTDDIQAIEILLNLLEKKDKIIDLTIAFICKNYGSDEDITNFVVSKSNKKEWTNLSDILK